jgi:hypothetical protein
VGGPVGGDVVGVTFGAIVGASVTTPPCKVGLSVGDLVTLFIVGVPVGAAVE